LLTKAAYDRLQGIDLLLSLDQLRFKSGDAVGVWR
jgi:hypothetical protein